MVFFDGFESRLRRLGLPLVAPRGKTTPSSDVRTLNDARTLGARVSLILRLLQDTGRRSTESARPHPRATDAGSMAATAVCDHQCGNESGNPTSTPNARACSNQCTRRYAPIA